MAHNTFSRLVKSDNDLEGLVAYSLYKQEKINWCVRRAEMLQREVTLQEIEDQFVSMLSDKQIEQLQYNALQILNQFADNMLAAELEKEREAIKNDALVKAVKLPFHKRLFDNVVANIVSAALITLSIAAIWLISSVPENFIEGIIAKSVQGKLPQATVAD